MTLVDIGDHIAVTLARFGALPPSGGWSYFLDMLELVESEREWLRATGSWPAIPEEVDSVRNLYRVCLVILEGRLRTIIEGSVSGQDVDSVPIHEPWLELLGAGKQLVAALADAGAAH